MRQCNDNLCGAKFSLNLWIKKQKEASVCENLKFFDTKIECNFANAYVVLCAFEMIRMCFTAFFAFYTAYKYVYMYNDL